MAKKGKKPQDQISDLAKRINDTIARWKNHYNHGCNDPTYPDGLNMNLLRNHLIYYKQQIRELCSTHDLPLPTELYAPDLPYTDCNYFAKPESDRAKRIMSRPGWQCYNHEPIAGEYDERQLSLF